MKLWLAVVTIVLANLGLAQTTHEIRGYDFYFIPDTVFIQPGDSIKFTNFGIHNMAEIDSIDWVNNMNIPNGGFYTEPSDDTIFAINSAGTHYFICSPHAPGGMKGVIFSGITVSTEEYESAPMRIYPNPTTSFFTIDNPIAEVPVRIYDMLGQLLFSVQYNDVDTPVDVSSIAPGIYLVECGPQIALLKVQ